VSPNSQAVLEKVIVSLALPVRPDHGQLGLSAATFDPEYQARRRIAQRRNKPRHAMYLNIQIIFDLSDSP
jgi:hypothetical protein